MNVTLDASKGVLPGFLGPTARSEAEKPHDTPTAVGEASRPALGDSGDDAAPIHTGETPLVESELEIVRATMALRLEPWALLASKEERDEHARQRCGGKEVCRACALSSALYDVQRECARAANFIARTSERIDGAMWDALPVSDDGKRVLPRVEKTLPDGKKKAVVAWPSDGYNAYAEARKACPTTLSGIIAAVSHHVTTKWRKERFDVLATMERSAARYKRATMPIPMRAADCRFVESEVRDRFELHCSLTSGRQATKGKEFCIPISAFDQRQYNVLRALARGEYKLGEISIKRDRRDRHWEARLSYKRRVEVKSGGKLGAVNRGIACVLALVTEDGEAYVYDGRDIEAYLAQMQARRKEYQRDWKVSGRKGHGVRKALEPTERLEGKASRWRRTRMQTIAREAAKWFAARGVTKVLVDDLKGIREGSVESLEGGKAVWDRIQSWPYFEQGARLESCLLELGIKSEKRPVAFASRDCPACHHRQEERIVSRSFKCEACGFQRHIDVVLGMNLIGRERGRAAADEGSENGEKSEGTGGSVRGARKGRRRSSRFNGKGGRGRKR